MILQERHKIQYLISVAVIFLILGLGNVIYGNAKYKEYKGILKETSLEINNNSGDIYTALKDISKTPLTDSSIERTRHLKRSQGRIIFYQFFVTGGKVFLCISLLFFLIAFTIKKREKK